MSLYCNALRSNSLNAWPKYVGAYTPTCLVVTLLRGTAIRFLERVVPSCQDTGAKSNQPPPWLAAVVGSRPVAARVAREVWGHALLLAGRACLLEPAAGLSHRPPLQQAILVPADKCCPSWHPKLSTVRAWLAVGLVPDPVP